MLVTVGVDTVLVTVGVDTVLDTVVGGYRVSHGTGWIPC